MKTNFSFSDIKTGDHICSIYKNADEKFSVLISFFRAGLENRQRCIYIADENTKQEIIFEFFERGMDLRKFMKLGQFLIITKHETYLKNGCFDPDEMIGLSRESEKITLDEGYLGLRVAGDMTWSLKGTRGSDRLIEYEAMLNSFFPKSKITAICQYNEKKFKPGILAEVIHTHPLTIIYGKIYENLYYFSPRKTTNGYTPLPENSYELIKEDLIREIK